MESLGAALETSGHSLDMESNDFEIPRARIAEESESQLLSATDRRTLRPELVVRRTNLRNCPTSFSALLRLWRYEAGLTLQDVASAVGVSKPTVWSWEKGKNRPGRDKWHALAKALGVTPDVLASAAKNSALANVISSECEIDGHDREALIAQGRAMIAKAYNVTSSAVRILVEV